MQEEKKGFIKWVKANKKELIIAGVSSATIIGIIVGIKNKDSIIALWESLNKSVDSSPVKVSTVSQKVIKSNVHEPAQVGEVVSAREIIKFSSNHDTRVPFEVCDHIRNLPNGWHASAEKIATAAEHGYNIQQGQTWVDTYTKGISAA